MATWSWRGPEYFRLWVPIGVGWSWIRNPDEAACHSQKLPWAMGWGGGGGGTWSDIQRQSSILTWIVILSVYGADTIAEVKLLISPFLRWSLGPKWHSLRSMPFKGPGVSRAPSPPLAQVMHSPLWNLLCTGPKESFRSINSYFAVWRNRKWLWSWQRA